MMEQNKLLAGLLRVIREALNHENGVTAQKELIEKFCRQKNKEQCFS